MIKEELSKAIDMQEEFGNPFIVIHKPKNNIVEFDSDTAVFDIVEDKVMFDFWEIEGFNIKMTDIKSVVFENAFTDMTIVHVKLKNGNTVMLNFLHK
jgi:hypothetical protein